MSKLDKRKSFWLDNSSPTKNKDQSGYIYFIKENKTGTVKIGKSKSLKKRYRLFEVKLPFEIDCIVYYKVNDRHQVESALHDIFSDYRCNGEWFELEEEQIDKITNLVLPEKVTELVEKVGTQDD